MPTIVSPETLRPTELAQDMRELVYQVSVCADPFAEISRRHEEHGEAGFYNYSDCSVTTEFMSDGSKVRILRGMAQIAATYHDGTLVSFECDSTNDQEAESVIRIARLGATFTFETRQEGGATETVHTRGGQYNLSNLASAMNEGVSPIGNFMTTLQAARNALNKVFGDGIDK